MDSIELSRKDRRDDIKLILEALVIGTMAGLISVFYRFLLHHIEHFLEWLPGTVRAYPLAIPVMFIGLAVLALIVGRIREWESFCGGSGIPQVEAEIKGYINQNPIRILIAKIVGGALSVFGGLSVGREGPSIQMGAMSGKLFSRLIKRNKTTEKFLMTCGASAGLAGAFNAPVAGVLFSLEEVHRHFSRKLLVSAITAAVTADFVSKLFYGPSTVFEFHIERHLPFREYWILIPLAVILALCGVLYNHLMKVFSNFYDNLRMPGRYKPLFAFVVSGVMILVLPQVLGGGHIMIDYILHDHPTIGFLLLLFVVKLLFSLFSFTSGVPGGIFFPLLILGSTLGVIFSRLLAPDYPQIFIILSMAGFLTAVVRAPLTSIILIFEMTGRLSYLLPLTIVCLITYAMANYLRSLPVYEYLLERLLRNNPKHEEGDDEVILVEAVIQPGSHVVGKELGSISWPAESLVVKIERPDGELVPNGETVLQTGDVLHIMVNHRNLAKSYQWLEELCDREHGHVTL